MGYGVCYMIVPFHAKDKIEEIIGLKCSKSNSYFKIEVHTNILRYINFLKMNYID